MRMLTLLITALLFAATAQAQTPQVLTEQDKTDIQALVTGYARALGACNAEQYADLFADNAFFASGFRGHVVGRDRLIAMVKSERQCINPPAAPAAPSNRPGPTVTFNVTPKAVKGIADLGAAGAYEDEYVKTPKGWRFAGRTVLTPAEKAAGLDAAAMIEIRKFASGPQDAPDYWPAGQDGVKRFNSAGVVIRVAQGVVNGRAYLKDGGYYDDIYEKSAQGSWRFKSRTYVPESARQ